MNEIRLTQGLVRGRRLRFARQGIRPTPQKIRQAIFSILGPSSISGACVLELCAGSGAFSLEAAGLGAKEVVSVDMDRDSTQHIHQAAERFALTNVKVLKSDVTSFLKSDNRLFDIIFVDPPYHCLLLAEIAPLVRMRLNVGGVLICEDDPKADGALDLILYAEAGLKLVKRKQYGRTRITFFENAEGMTP